MTTTTAHPAEGVDTRALTREMRRANQPTRISKVPYLPGLDGMRAIAVVAVMIYHANHSWLGGGFLGVDVFFVISGYLITLLIIGEDEKTGGLNLRQFWARRARRLLPALFTLLIGVTIYTAFFNRDALGKLRGDVIAGLSYVGNWYQIWTGQGYTAGSDFAPLRHLWSLAVEEQFYLLWPLLMVGLLRLGRRRLPDISRWLIVAAVAITVVTSLLYRSGSPGICDVSPEQYWQVGSRCISKSDTLYLGTITRSSGLLLGGAMAMLWRPFALRRGAASRLGRASDVAGVTGLVALGVLVRFMYYDETGASPWLFRGGIFLTGVATLAVIMGVTHPHAVLGKLLGNPVFLWVGTRSYGLYLYHWPVYQAIRKIAGKPLTLPQFAGAVIISAVITEVSFRVIETPIRKRQVGAWWDSLRRRRDNAPKQIVAAGAVLGIGLSVFAITNLATAELKQNPVERSLEEGQGAVTDIIGGATPTPAGSTTVATAAVTVAVTAAPTSPPGNVIIDTTLPGETAPPTAVPPTPTVAAPTPTAAVVTPTAVPAAPVPAETAAPTTTGLPDALPRFALGDSVMLGAAPVLQEAGFVVDATESRQFASVVEPISMIAAAGRFTDTVVVSLGTNGTIGPDAATAVFDALRNVPRVLVLTVRADRSWTAGNNELINSLPSRYPNVRILDWANVSNQCPGNCFYSDNIHLRPDGRRFYADVIRQALGI